MPTSDPYAPPEKVRDDEAVGLLRQLLAAIQGKDVVRVGGLAATPQAAPAPKLDLGPLVAKLDAMSRQIAQLGMSTPKTLPPVRLDDGGVAAEIRAAAAELRKAAGKAGGKLDLPAELTRALTQIASRGPGGGGIGAKVFQIRDDSRGAVFGKGAPGYVSPSSAAKVGDGKARSVGMTQSVASGSNGTFSVTNPANSGVVAYILEVGAYNDSTEQIRFEVWEDSTIDAAANTADPWDPNRNTRSTSPLTLQYGVGVRSGGTQLDAVLPATREHPYGFSGLIVLPPGRSLQLTGVVPGPLSAQQLTVTGHWYEEAP